MEKVSTPNYTLLPILIISLILFIGIFYGTTARANTPISQQPPGTQLAWVWGYHPVYYGNHHRHWRYYRHYPRHWGYGYRHHRYWRYHRHW